MFPLPPLAALPSAGGRESFSFSCCRLRLLLRCAVDRATLPARPCLRLRRRWCPAQLRIATMPAHPHLCCRAGAEVDTLVPLRQHLAQAGKVGRVPLSLFGIPAPMIVFCNVAVAEIQARKEKPTALVIEFDFHLSPLPGWLFMEAGSGAGFPVSAQVPGAARR